jgi:hypothetical protein
MAGEDAALAAHPRARTGSNCKAMKAMKAMKTMKVMKMMKAMKGMKAGASEACPAMAAPSVMKKAMKRARMKKASKRSKRPTIIAKGPRAKAAVYAGRKARTIGGLTKVMLMKNKRGKIVSKKVSDASKRKFAKGLAKWNDAVRLARASLRTIGFIPVNGKTAAGKQIYQKAKQFYARA